MRRPAIQVRKYVIRRQIEPKDESKKPYTKAPKIQRLVTPQRLQHKRHRIALKRRQAEKVKDEAVSRLPARSISSASVLTPGPERVHPDPRQARCRGQGPQGRCPQASRQLHAQVRRWNAGVKSGRGRGLKKGRVVVGCYRFVFCIQEYGTSRQLDEFTFQDLARPPGAGRIADPNVLIPRPAWISRVWSAV